MASFNLSVHEAYISNKMSFYLLYAIFDPGEAGRAPPELAGLSYAFLLIPLISSVFELFPEFA